MGKSPMVMIYESQFIQRAAAADGSVTPGVRSPSSLNSIDSPSP
jgi:hypothetical protein